MHLLGFFIQKLIEEDQSENICYKFLKVEQAMERIHHIWKVLEKTRFYSVRTKREKLLYTFLEYENSLYINDEYNCYLYNQ